MTLHTLSHCLLAAFALCYAPLQAASHPDVQLPNRYPAIQSHISQQGQVEFSTHTALTNQVLGYTDAPVPADVEMPSNLQSWLQCVQEAADYVALHPDQPMGTAQASNVVIHPLLGNIMWNQSSPWSDLCPSGTPVGCVATAMAQVLYYYRYPEHGYGTHSYTNHNIRHSVNYGETYYQWDQMFDYDNGHRSAAQNHAVAELSYHCGVAIDMDYAPGGSGAWTERIPARLHEYFGYNSKASTICRSGYTYQQWCDVLIQELQADRPVIFAGTSSDVGHCFVIDGINAEGLFHVNWGWGGYYNGYFDIGILEPEGQGIGGSAEATLGFCLNQRAVVQLCPEEGLGIDYCPITCENFGIWWDGYGYSTGFTFQNNSGYTPHAILGIDLANAETGEVVHTSDEITKDFGSYPNRGYWSYDYFSLGTLDLPDGYYELKPYCILPDNDSIRYDMHFNLCRELGVYIETGEVLLWERGDEVLDLEISNFVQEDVTEFAVGRLYDFEFDVTNTSNDVFVGTIEVNYYTDGPGGTMEWDFSSPDTKLLPGETQHIVIPVTFEVDGDYQLYIGAFSYPYEVMALFEETEKTVHASFTAESPAKLTLAEIPQLLTERCEVDGEVSFRLVLDNAGGNFSNKLAIQLFNNKTAITNPVVVIAQDEEIEMTTTGNEVILTGLLTGAKGMTKYFARPFYKDQYNKYQPIFDASGKVTPIEVKVYNASGIESIHNDPATTRQYDLLGRPVREGHRGLVIQL